MHRWGEHTGELKLEIEAPSERAIFEQAFEAMRELLGEDDGGGETAPPRRVWIQARDHPALLADWLAELAFLAEEGLVPERLAALTLREAGLEALIEGHPGEPPHLVKAATYHDLLLERRGSIWLARVVLDV